MSASIHRRPLRPDCRPREPGPYDGPERLRWLIRRIADDDRDAFAALFDRYSDGVSRRLRRQVSDPDRVAGVLAGTFVEVWWLAGGHVDPDTDVMAWIDEIVQRRVADSRPAAPSSADPSSPGPSPLDPNSLDPNSLGALLRQRVEVELAELLRRGPAAAAQPGRQRCR